MGISFSRADSATEVHSDTNNHHNGHNGSLRESDIRIDAGNSVKFPTKQLPNYHIRQNSIRSKQPLPDATEVEKQFGKLLVSQDCLYNGTLCHFLVISFLVETAK